MTATLHVGDCLGPDGLRSLADRSVDHFLTDPPYSEHVHAKLGAEDRNDGAVKREALGFECITAVLADDLAEQFCRVARRWILIFCDEIAIAMWAGAIRAVGGEYVRAGSWVKSDAMPQMSGDRPSAGTEAIVIAHAPRAKGSGRMKWNGGGKAAVWRGPAQERNVPRVHPTQKPLWLLRSLVEDFSDEGDTIVDPFSGSGTTLVAAESLGRNSIGWERDAAFYETAMRRLRGEEAKPAPGQLAMFAGVAK